MATTIGTKNIGRPAPRWYRITKKIVYGLFATALFSSTLQRFGVSDKDVTLIAAWLVSGMETLGAILANGEDYIVQDKQTQSPNHPI
jgi:hypothetical protein